MEPSHPVLDTPAMHIPRWYWFSGTEPISFLVRARADAAEGLGPGKDVVEGFDENYFSQTFR